MAEAVSAPVRVMIFGIHKGTTFDLIRLIECMNENTLERKSLYQHLMIHAKTQIIKVIASFQSILETFSKHSGNSYHSCQGAIDFKLNGQPELMNFAKLMPDLAVVARRQKPSLLHHLQTKCFTIKKMINHSRWGSNPQLT